MITEWIIDAGFKLAEFFFELLPDFEWSVASNAWTAAKDILDGVCYFLPLETVSAIISLVVGLAMMRVTFKFISIILSFIPFI